MKIRCWEVPKPSYPPYFELSRVTFVSGQHTRTLPVFLLPLLLHCFTLFDFLFQIDLPKYFFLQYGNILVV